MVEDATRGERAGMSPRELVESSLKSEPLRFVILNEDGKLSEKIDAVQLEAARIFAEKVIQDRVRAGEVEDVGDLLLGSRKVLSGVMSLSKYLAQNTIYDPGLATSMAGAEWSRHVVTAGPEEDPIDRDGLIHEAGFVFENKKLRETRSRIEREISGLKDIGYSDYGEGKEKLFELRNELTNLSKANISPRSAEDHRSVEAEMRNLLRERLGSLSFLRGWRFSQGGEREMDRMDQRLKDFGFGPDDYGGYVDLGADKNAEVRGDSASFWEGVKVKKRFLEAQAERYRKENERLETIRREAAEFNKRKETFEKNVAVTRAREEAEKEAKEAKTRQIAEHRDLEISVREQAERVSQQEVLYSQLEVRSSSVVNKVLELIGRGVSGQMAQQKEKLEEMKERLKALREQEQKMREMLESGENKNNL